MAKTRFHTLLDAKLREVLVSRGEDLTSGVAKDYAEYKFEIGYLRALKDVLKICDEVNEEMQ